ncbi:MAG TPA: hypothetical protein IAA79_03455 [Candidatus Avirikenella pullistercoris]|nr:hypothetical protein [Candidatus Avirikenella pullistercoris]
MNKLSFSVLLLLLSFAVKASVILPELSDEAQPVMTNFDEKLNIVNEKEVAGEVEFTDEQQGMITEGVEAEGEITEEQYPEPQIQDTMQVSIPPKVTRYSAINDPVGYYDSEKVDTVKTRKGKKDYVNFLFLKVNRNKGYGKQAFESEDRYALLEKRVTYFSFRIGFSSNDIDDMLLEPLATIDDVYRRNFSAAVSAGHLVANNVAVGLKFGYTFNDTRLKLDADILDIVIGAKSYETNNVSSAYTGAVVLRNYLPLDAAQRFFIVSETSLLFTYTNALSRNVYDNGTEIHKIKKDKLGVGLGISPGFMYFMTRGFAFEFAMNPVVAYWEKTKLVNNEVDKGSMTSYGLSFKFMPFNIQFGFAYYFGLDYFKNREYVNSLRK